MSESDKKETTVKTPQTEVDAKASAAAKEAPAKATEAKTAAKTATTKKTAAAKTTAAKSKTSGAVSKAMRGGSAAKPAAPAVSEDDCGLKLFLQPMYAPKERAVFGYECLLRIVDMELGMLSPGVFLDVAEKHPNLIAGMERWAIEEICDMIKKAGKSSASASLFALNISTKHFFEPDFYATVAKAVKESGINASRLGIELKEEVLFERPEYVDSTFRKLRELGVKVAIDDFGIEFFSVFRDKVPNIDAVKIDRSYTQSFLTNPKSKTIVSAVIDYASGNGLDVIAVGVEKQEQEDALLELGCEKMQGFLYARPHVEKKTVRRKQK